MTPFQQDGGKFYIDDAKQYFLVSCRYGTPSVARLVDDLGARWESYSKLWKVAISPRSIAVMEHLMLGQLPSNSVRHNWTPTVPQLMQHQAEIVNYALSHLGCIIAAEMGCGKTLAAFEIMNYLKGSWLWLSPKSIIPSTRLEIQKWGFDFTELRNGSVSSRSDSKSRSDSVITFSTYDFKYHLRDAPVNGVICDEATMVKNPSSQRAKRLVEFVNRMRQSNKNFRIYLMTGTPAPKDPTDLWQLVELAQPGFLRYANKKKLLRQLAHVRDHTMKHAFDLISGWKIDQVEKFARDIDPIRFVVLAKDCLDLPEQVFITRRITPSKDLLQQARLIADTVVNPAHCANLLRQISDGFYYVDEKEELDTSQTCPLCKDTGSYPTPDGVANCDCRFTGAVVKKSFRLHSKKLEALDEWLVKAEEDGRIIIFAPFIESLDMICEYLRSQDWDFIRLDGKGWKTSLASHIQTQPHDGAALLSLFQQSSNGSSEQGRKIAFVANPACGGFGLNLTAARITVFYSNSFHGIHRMQGIKRNHRIGSRGSTIVDLVHLGVDDLVMKNIENKISLQAVTMKDIQDALTSKI